MLQKLLIIGHQWFDSCRISAGQDNQEKEDNYDHCGKGFVNLYDPSADCAPTFFVGLWDAWVSFRGLNQSGMAPLTKGSCHLW